MSMTGMIPGLFAKSLGDVLHPIETVGNVGSTKSGNSISTYKLFDPNSS